MKAVELELDDRREIWTILKRMTPGQRIDFVRWCCRQVNGPDRVSQVFVTSHTGTTDEAYRDLMHLEIAFHLDLKEALKYLEGVARRL